MKVAITGGNGFLAGYLTDELLVNGHEVVLLSRSEGVRKGIPYTVTDYSKESLEEIFGGGIEGIAHLASARIVADSLDYYSQLFKMTNMIYEVAAECGIRDVVYTSSISVYSGENLPYTEDQLPAPKNMYGLFKLTCERIGEIFNSSKRMYIKNLRLAHLYGANENNNYMINRFFRQAYAHEQLTVMCESHARREMLYTKDAARAIRIALEHHKLCGTFNIGSGDALTNEEIAKTICSVMSPELTVKLGNDKETITSSYMSSQQAKQSLGYEAKYNLNAATKEIMEDMTAP